MSHNRHRADFGIHLRAFVRDAGQMLVKQRDLGLCANVCPSCAQLYAKVHFNILKINDFFVAI